MPASEASPARSAFRLLAWLVAGIALFVFSNGRWIIPAAAWVAPVFLLRFLRSTRALMGLPLVSVLFLGAEAVMLYGIVPPFLGLLTYLLTSFYALLWFAPYLMDRFLVRTLRGFAATLVFQMAVVAVEYLPALAYGTWGSVAYTQYEHLPLLQIASVTGLWGVTFLVCWFGAVVNWMWEEGFAWERIRAGGAIFACVLATALFFGGARLAIFPPAAKTVRVAGFTGSGDALSFYAGIERRGYKSVSEMSSADREGLCELARAPYDQLFERSRVEARAGAAVVLWPETMAKVPEEDEADFIARGRELARAERFYLLVAYSVIPRERPERARQNKDVLFSPQGAVLWTYLKTHPVPTSTDVPGDGIIPTADAPFARLATAICYDMDFPNLIRQAGRKRADVMLVPAWDWREIDPLHARMAVLRAIENGFSMVRQTGEGLSIAVDYQGRVLAAMDHFTTEDRVMIAQVPARGVSTIYARFGDWFAWLCIASLIAILACHVYRWRLS